MNSLTQEQITQFQQDGYLVVRSVISAQTLKNLCHAADEIVVESRHITQSDDNFTLEPDHTSDRLRLRQVRHPVVHRPIFWNVATSNEVLDCVEGLIGPNIKFHHSKLNMKVERGGTEIGWHQDVAFFPYTNFDLVACGLALDDTTVENGCLLVVPGSHRIGMLNHRDETGEFVGKITVKSGGFDSDEAVPVELKAGDMSIHHVAVAHCSLANQSSRSRRVAVFQYAACDAIPLDHRPPENEFSQKVVRGTPATHARLAGAMVLPLRGDTGGARSLFDRQLAENR